VLAWRSPAHVRLVEQIVDQIFRSLERASCGLLVALTLLEFLA
jgi:hypothetical protein